MLLRGETAAALGSAGARLQQALAPLASFDHHGPKYPQPNHDELLHEAAAALYGYVIQKELNGIADHDTLQRSFAIPAEVWQQMGRVHTKG